MEVNFLEVTFPTIQKTKWYHTSTPNQIIHHKSLSTSLKPSVNGYPEILQALKYFNNQNQIMKKHWKNVVTKENCNTYNQIFSKITLEKERRKSFGSTHLLVEM